MTALWRIAAAVLASILAIATVLGSLACFLAAIWVHGPDSARFGGTACVLALTSVPTVLLAVAAVAGALDA